MAGGVRSDVEGFAEVLQLLHDMETKLTAAIATGLATVNATMAALAEAHHRAQLEQERRNATFADRERVEQLSQRLHDTRMQVAAHEDVLGAMKETDKSLQAQVLDVGTQMNSRSLKALSGVNGYLVSVVLIVFSVLLTYVLTHVH